jgi:hypothetical protein
MGRASRAPDGTACNLEMPQCRAGSFAYGSSPTGAVIAPRTSLRTSRSFALYRNELDSHHRVRLKKKIIT